MKHNISILIPAYNESESINELYKQLIASIHAMQANGMVDQYEIVFVNDGSKDDTEQVIEQLHLHDSSVHMVSFRKNFGKSPALDAGFKHVNGDIVFTMDSDLQDDPAELPRFIEKIDEGYDVVVGWKFNRLDPAEKRLPSKLFNKVTSYLSGVKLHDHDCGFKAFRREVVDSIDVYGELHRYIPVLAHRMGFRITEITVEHHKREFGHSKYGMERYLRGLFDSLTTTFLLHYGDRPMYFFGKVGLAAFLGGAFVCIYLTCLWLAGHSIGNRPLLVLGVLCIILGIQSIATGFIGNLLVDITHREHYTENHIKKII